MNVLVLSELCQNSEGLFTFLTLKGSQTRMNFLMLTKFDQRLKAFPH